MFAARIIANLSKNLLTTQQLPAFTASVANFSDLTRKGSGSRHGGFIKSRYSYRVLRDRPVGPFKKLPPGFVYDGRTGPMGNYRFIVHYPEDGKYTIRKLPITKLGGRDPETGRRIIQGVGGGSKWKYRWIDWQRLPSDWSMDGPDLVEKVISIHYDPVRKPMIALTGHDDKLRWQIATDGMKEGDLITSSCKIPSIPVQPVPGNAHPVGALPPGTQICLLQKYHDKANDKFDLLFNKENESGIIVRKVGDRVIVENERRLQLSFDQRCMCVVGKVSIHPLKAMHIGSPNRMRWMGMRPRSGLWIRKTGRFGKKIKALPPVIAINAPEPPKDKTLILNCGKEGNRGSLKQSQKPWLIDSW